MKYIICSLPMLLCVEAVSIACLFALTMCLLADFAKAKGGR